MVVTAGTAFLKAIVGLDTLKECGFKLNHYNKSIANKRVNW